MYSTKSTYLAGVGRKRGRLAIFFFQQDEDVIEVEKLPVWRQGQKPHRSKLTIRELWFLAIAQLSQYRTQ